MTTLYKKILNHLFLIFLLQAALCASFNRTQGQTSLLSSHNLIEKIKTFLEEHPNKPEQGVELSVNMIALQLAEKAQTLLANIIHDFNGTSGHNLVIQQKFMQAYNATLPEYIRPKDLRLFAKNIIEFDSFLDAFAKQRRWTLTTQELVLIQKIRLLNSLLTKGVLHCEFLPIETKEYVLDAFVHRPCEFAKKHKRALLCAAGVLVVAGLSYYIVYPQLIRWGLGNKNKNFNCYQFIGLDQKHGADCGYFAMLHAMLMIKFGDDKKKVEAAIAHIKKNGLETKIVAEMKNLVIDKQNETKALRAGDIQKLEQEKLNLLIQNQNDDYKFDPKIAEKVIWDVDEYNAADQQEKNNIYQRQVKLAVLKEETQKKKKSDMTEKDNEALKLFRQKDDYLSEYRSLGRGAWADQGELEIVVRNLDQVPSLDAANLRLSPEQLNLLKFEEACGSTTEIDDPARINQIQYVRATGRSGIVLRLGTNEKGSMTHWIAVYLPKIDGKNLNTNQEDAWIIDSYAPLSRFIPSWGLTNRTDDSNVDALLHDYNKKEFMPEWYQNDVGQPLDNINMIHEQKIEQKDNPDWNDEGVGRRLFWRLYQAAQGLCKPDRALVLNKCHNDLEGTFLNAKALYQGPILDYDGREVVPQANLQEINSFAELFFHVNQAPLIEN